MTRTMIVRVRYEENGKDFEKLFIKCGNLTALQKGFNDVRDMYINLQKRYGLKNLTITSEMVFETRPMKFSYSKY